MWKFTYQNELYQSINSDLCIHIIAYNRPTQLMGLLYSLAAQTLQNFHVVVTHDGANQQIRSQIIAFGMLNLIPLAYKESIEHHGSWGYALRQQCLMETQTSYWMSTNDDNYYVPVFTHFLAAGMQSNADLILVDMIHSHRGPGGRNQPEYNLFQTMPSHCNCDMGSLVINTKMAQNIGGFPTICHDSDGQLVEKLVASYPTLQIYKIDKVLFVHN